MHITKTARSLAGLIVLVIVGALETPALGQCLSARIYQDEDDPRFDISSGNGDIQSFGSGVAIDGDQVLIGAGGSFLGYGENFSRPGVAFVYVRNGSTWTWQDTLIPDDPNTEGFGGRALAISGDYVVVASDLEDDACTGSNCRSGAVYVFRREGPIWVPDGRATPSDDEAYESPPLSVAISGDLIVVGTPLNRNGNKFSRPGAVYVFRRIGSSWVEEQRLTASGVLDIDGFPAFGWSVAISEGRILVGASGEINSRSGAAFVFEHDGAAWVESAALTASDAATGDQFGWSVALDGDVAVVGAGSDDDVAFNSGSAYVFRRVGSEWIEEAKLIGSELGEWSQFGHAVGVSGDWIAVSAFSELIPEGVRGSGYLFRFDGQSWIEQSVLRAPDGANFDWFGLAMDIDGDTVFIGDTKSPYVYALGPDCNANGTPDPCEVADGLVADCNENGIPDECDPDCDANATVDECDLVAGVSEDCNVNAIPDVCEIDAGAPANAYGLLDECAAPITPRCETQKINPVGGWFDKFGYSTAIDGDYAIVGVPGDDTFTGVLELPDEVVTTDGAAYIYHRQGSEWIEQAKLLPDGLERLGFYARGVGWSVDIDGDVAVVGAFFGEVAYIFRRAGTNWILETVLTAPDAAEFREIIFGSAVAVSGNLVVVGAEFDSEFGLNTGSAYLFRYDGAEWAFEAKIFASDPAPLDTFGQFVAVSGDRVLVGVDGHDDLGSLSGAAFVFRRDGGEWVQEAHLLASDGVAGDVFGRAVAIDGDRLALGAFGNDDLGFNSGGAYIFRREGTSWIEEAKLLPSDGQAGDNFGEGVDISGDLVLIGASQSVLDDPGKAYIFKREGTSWNEQAILTASDATPNSLMGWETSSGLSGGTAIVGAHKKTNGAITRSGAAYVFEQEGSSWTQQTKLTNFDPDPLVEYGVSVAINGDLAAVGAPFEVDPNELPLGAVHLYRREGLNWNLLARLTFPGGGNKGTALSISGDVMVGAFRRSGQAEVYTPDEFGSWVAFEHVRLEPATHIEAGPVESVSIDGDCVLLGAPGAALTDTRSGAVHVFRWDGQEWLEEPNLVASDAATDDRFGQSVVVDGDLALIGAPLTDDEAAGYNAGSVYVFRHDKSGWFEDVEILPFDATAFDEFGTAIALSGDYLVVTAPGNDELGAEAGAAYVFRYDGLEWIEDAKLLASDGLAGDRFGNAVAIHGDAIVVAAENDGIGGTGAHTGSAYLFRHDGSQWYEETVLNSSDSMWWDRRLGSSVAVSEDSVFVGALFADSENIARTGAVYVYNLDNPDCDGNGLPDECESDCNANGIPDPCDLFPPGTSEDCNLDSIPDECQLVDNDCNANAIPDDCDADINEDGVPDDCCTDNAFCDDDDPCNFDRCVSNVCQYAPAVYGDVASTAANCGPDGTVDLSDILAILDGFQGVLAAGCEVSNVDIASQSDGCAPDGVIDLSDILAVLDAFQGATTCCAGG